MSPDRTPTRVWKRTLDITLIALALPLLLPVMLVIAVLIWIVSPGPVFFRQERVGYLGRRFMCFKFRTMVLGADPAVHEEHLHNLLESDAPMIKKDAEGDPRVIPLGSILRSSGLDELPQVINVLLGEMSLVGPRPCLPFEYEKYFPWQRERFNAVPGLTGLWQVSGKNRTTFMEMIQLDIKYARTRTLWLDLKIIFETIPALIVQMRDDRTRKTSLVPSAQPKAAGSARAARHHSTPGTATVDPVTPFTRDFFLTRTETRP
ncbi:MAG: sugar transferase [Verrucomicrobia bacterium]|jgi:lipopolysaccharide/colanic/teichoic acid biosynthesis glycosyltransferase|nr:sugar transferase [Verrucomicrobiota bacterium]